MARLTIEVVIDTLALHGFPPGDYVDTGQAVERELARLLLSEGLPPSFAQGGELARLSAPTVQVPPDAAARGLGAQIARALYSSMRQPGQR